MWDDAGAAGRIMQRIKEELDPNNVLNPGRFVGRHLSDGAHAHRRSRRAAPRSAHAPRPVGRGREPVRALRALSRVLPDLLRARHRDGFAARAHLHDQVARRGPHVAQRLRGGAPVAVPRLPRVRDRVPGRRAVRPPDRSGEGGDRAPAARRRPAPRVPLAELRPAARPSARAPRGRRRASPVPGERAADARAPQRAGEALAGHAARVGGAAAADARRRRPRAPSVLTCPPRASAAGASRCSRAACSPWCSARTTARPRASSRGTATRSSFRPRRGAVARSTRTAAITRARSRWRSGRSRCSRRRASTRSSSTRPAAGPT